MKLLVIIGLVAASVALLSLGVVLRKDKQFRSQHISQNPRMKERGIHCATSQDFEARRDAKKKLNIKDL